MRVLLDTNIIIHRENRKISNYSIGHLFKWLDKLKCEKIVHPFTCEEINKYNDKNVTEVLNVKLESYNVLQTVKLPDDEFLKLIGDKGNDDNDRIDNVLLHEVYVGRVDALITEDKKMHRKSINLGIERKVYTINRFITVATSKFPALVGYKSLAVKQEYFGNIDINNSFFDSFKRDYDVFESWFNKKCDEKAYICKQGIDFLGFLYLKVETEEEGYPDIMPQFLPKKRLKVGTFKVESTGFRLGERFLKIIFDNAIQFDVDEIYVTLFMNRPELAKLAELLQRWGFQRTAEKTSSSGKEDVLVKKMKEYDINLSAKENFPNIIYNKQKFILPIFAKYHTSLLPDSRLNNENEANFLTKDPYKYAIQKVYISWAVERNIFPGDFIVFYRIGDEGTRKKYTSVVTTLGIIDEIITEFKTQDDYLKHCQNRSVFTDEELDDFWKKRGNNLMIVKFIYVKSFEKRLTLEYLVEKGVVNSGSGPRPFSKLTDEQFNDILKDSQAEIIFNTRRNE